MMRMKVRQMGTPSQMRSIRYVPRSSEAGENVNPCSRGSLASEIFSAALAARNLLAVSKTLTDTLPRESFPFFAHTVKSATSEPSGENSDISGGSPRKYASEPRSWFRRQSIPALATATALELPLPQALANPLHVQTIRRERR